MLLYLQDGNLFMGSFVCGVHSKLGAHPRGEIYRNRISTKNFEPYYKGSENVSFPELVSLFAKRCPVLRPFRNHKVSAEHITQ